MARGGRGMQAGHGAARRWASTAGLAWCGCTTPPTRRVRAHTLRQPASPCLSTPTPSPPPPRMAELLLRLFHSSYFTPHLAITYLKTYWDSVGITHYLVRALERAFTWDQVRIYWPQLCHLLISRPDGPSAALEHFILARCGDSVHTALITLWFFQAARADWSDDPASPALLVSRRVINHCQRLLFDAQAPPAPVPRAVDEVSTAVSPAPDGPASPWAAWAAPFRRRRTGAAPSESEEARIHPAHALTTLVGMSAMAASAPGQPAIMTAAGPMTILEGCKPAPDEFDRLLRRTADEEPSDDEGDDESFSGSSVASDDEDNEAPPPLPPKNHLSPLAHPLSPEIVSEPERVPVTTPQADLPSPTPTAPPVMEEAFSSVRADSPAPLSPTEEASSAPTAVSPHLRAASVPFPGREEPVSSNSEVGWTRALTNASWGSWGASLWTNSTSEKFAELKDRAAGMLAAGMSQVQIVPPPGMLAPGPSDEPRRHKRKHHHNHSHPHSNHKTTPASPSPMLVHQAGNRLAAPTQGPYGYSYASSGPEGFGNTPPTLLARAASTARSLAFTQLIQPPPGTVQEPPKTPGSIPGAAYGSTHPVRSMVYPSSQSGPPPASLNLGHFSRGAPSQSTPNLARGGSVPNLVRQAPSSSSGNLFRLRGRRVSAASVTGETQLGSELGYEERVALLRSHYARTQTDFLARLESISGRLLLLPKPARVSALRAELTELNHMLPLEACLPLWCAATSDVLGRHKHHEPQTKLERHHRIVRINPSEAVVLNSADRAPYVLQIEVLRNDLDFDPDRRANRDTMRRLLTKEAQSRTARGASDATLLPAAESVDAVARPRTLSNPIKAASHTRLDLSSPTMEPIPQRNHSIASSGSGLGLPPADSLARSLSQGATGGRRRPPLGQKAHTDMPSPQSVHVEMGVAEGTVEAEAHTGDSADETLTSEVTADDKFSPDAMFDDDPPEVEGVDMTEQAYGSHLERFGGQEDGGSSASESEGDGLELGPFASGSSRNRSHDTMVWRGSRGSQARSVDGKEEREFSLSDYSERMRTAAIMLAQLNQNRARKGWVITAPLGAAASGAASLVGVGAPAPPSEPGQGTAGVVSKLFPSWSQTTLPTLAPTHPASAGVSAAGGGAVVSSSSAARVIPADAEAIRARIMAEMIALEEERMARLRGPVHSHKIKKKSFAGGEGQGGEEDADMIRAAVNKDDPSAAIFRESWSSKRQRLRAASPYGAHAHWDVISVIIKTGADLRQEQLATQLVGEFSRIWQAEGSGVWVRYFNILVTSESSGLMETITDAVSVHSIKKEAYRQASGSSTGPGSEPIRTYSLWDHYTQVYGPPSSAKFKRAQDAFMRSLAGYSIICYLLQIKDRHNGNILVDHEGHLIRTSHLTLFEMMSWTDTSQTLTLALCLASRPEALDSRLRLSRCRKSTLIFWAAWKVPSLTSSGS